MTANTGALSNGSTEKRGSYTYELNIWKKRKEASLINTVSSLRIWVTSCIYEIVNLNFKGGGDCLSVSLLMYGEPSVGISHLTPPLRLIVFKLPM